MTPVLLACVGHAGATGDAMNQPFVPLQDAVHHPLGATRLPQDVHVDGAAPARNLMGALGLDDATVDGASKCV